MAWLCDDGNNYHDNQGKQLRNTERDDFHRLCVSVKCGLQIEDIKLAIKLIGQTTYLHFDDILEDVVELFLFFVAELIVMVCCYFYHHNID